MSQYIPKHFNRAEFACKCGCGLNNIDDEFLEALDQARELAGRSFVITSGCRCPKHNAAEGGSATSTHLTGRAADIAISDDRSRGAALAGAIRSGFRRLGIGKTFIHVDIDPAKPGAVWLYS